MTNPSARCICVIFKYINLIYIMIHTHIKLTTLFYIVVQNINNFPALFTKNKNGCSSSSPCAKESGAERCVMNDD